jgi:predicted nucleic acid-binding protein
VILVDANLLLYAYLPERNGIRKAGPLIMDAVLAAIALEHGATLCTTDCDFSRFSGFRWTNPLVTNG